MKRKLWTFGDSLTQSFGSWDAGWATEYVKWKGYVPKVFGEIIAEEMEFELFNLAKCGSDNYSIFQNVCDSTNLITNDDVILIGWSSCLRFRLANVDDEWEFFIPSNNKESYELKNISTNTIDEILVNRLSPIYIDEVKSWIKLIDVAFSDNLVIHWNYFERGVTPNHLLINENITKETNGEIEDSHLSETGHRIFANELMEMIKQKRTRSLI